MENNYLTEEEEKVLRILPSASSSFSLATAVSFWGRGWGVWVERGVKWRGVGGRSVGWEWGVGGGVKAEFANYFVLFILSLKMPFFDRGT